jgi:hypothetical protein
MKRRMLLPGAVISLAMGLNLNSGKAADAPLAPGDPLTGVTHVEFSGVGGTNTAGGALSALNAYEAAIGGVKNTAASPQNGGFRVITWDGVAVDGTDFGGNTTVIVPNKITGIPLNRFETQGVFFEEVYAVSGDGFKSVNTTVNAASPALFPSFSPTKTFAMFNDNGIGLSFVLASVANATPKPAATRGFGAIFFNVRIASTTSIEYFNGTRSLGKFFVPIGNQGQPEFLGELFSAPVVTSVQITCGTDVLFTFDGNTTASGGTDTSPHNLVVTDDFVYAEPTTATNAQPSIAATAGVSFTGVVARFSDLDANGVAKNFTAGIDWGDGFTAPGIIAADGNGGFGVSGSHTYTAGGNFPVTVDIADFEGSKLTIQNPAVVSGTGQILNIATRAKVETGDDVLIGGFIIGSTTSTTKVIIRPESGGIRRPESAGRSDSGAARQQRHDHRHQ